MGSRRVSENKAHAHICATNMPLRRQVETHSTPPNTSGIVRLRAQAPRSFLWPSDQTTLLVSFSDAGFDLDENMSYEEAKLFVQRVVERECNGICGITFRFVPDTSYHAANIRITFDKSSGAWSAVGKDADSFHASEPTMNLGWLDMDGDHPGGVILHEFGHAFGLIHEHSTEKFPFCWDRSAIIEELTAEPNNWSLEQIEHNVFDIVDSQLLSIHSSEYDEQSIMGYSFPPGYFLRNTAGCRDPPPNGIERKTAYSVADIAALRQMYPKSSTTSESDMGTSRWGTLAVASLVSIIVMFLVTVCWSFTNRIIGARSKVQLTHYTFLPEQVAAVEGC